MSPLDLYRVNFLLTSDLKLALEEHGLKDRISIPGRRNDEIFSLRHRVQSASTAQTSSYFMGTEVSYPESKAAVA
jgi:hypothetical protein